MLGVAGSPNDAHAGGGSPVRTHRTINSEKSRLMRAIPVPHRPEAAQRLHSRSNARRKPILFDDPEGKGRYGHCREQADRQGCLDREWLSEWLLDPFPRQKGDEHRSTGQKCRLLDRGRRTATVLAPKDDERPMPKIQRVGNLAHESQWLEGQEEGAQG